MKEEKKRIEASEVEKQTRDRYGITVAREGFDGRKVSCWYKCHSHIP